MFVVEKEEIREIERKCIEDEKSLIFDSFSQSEALKLGSFIYEKSKECSGPVAIEIRINRLTVFSFYPDGTNENNKLWLAAKAKTVDMTQKSSLRFWIDVQLSGSSAESKRMPESEYACCGGGFPLRAALKMPTNTEFVGIFYAMKMWSRRGPATILGHFLQLSTSTSTF